MWVGSAEGKHFSFMNQPRAAGRNYRMFAQSLAPLLDTVGQRKLNPHPTPNPNPNPNPDPDPNPDPNPTLISPDPTQAGQRTLRTTIDGFDNQAGRRSPAPVGRSLGEHG